MTIFWNVKQFYKKMAVLPIYEKKSSFELKTGKPTTAEFDVAVDGALSGTIALAALFL